MLTSDPWRLNEFVTVGREGERSSRHSQGRGQQVRKVTSQKAGKGVPNYLPLTLHQARDG